MTKQATTGGSATTRKRIRVPVAARNKALAKGSTTRQVSPTTTASRQKSRIDDGARHAMIAQAAYFRAERRGFRHGGELNDWLEAEREISRMLES